jgi:hypothetical protein
MANPLALENAEIRDKHMPYLFQSVILIAHENDDGEECIGSGVFVKLNDRHFVATAKHCIEHDPRVVFGRFTMGENQSPRKARIFPHSPARIIKSGWHSTLDLGYLEIASSPDVELTEAHLGFPITLSAPVHVIGHPIYCIERDESQNRIEIRKKVFQSKVIDITDECLKLDYPVEGFREEEGEWVREPFPKTPEGFSGGGCFVINKDFSTRLELIQYKLVGIQYSWPGDGSSRWVNVVPINHWADLVKPLL